MTREQAINYLISSGFSEEQVSEVVRALTYEPTPKNDLGVDCIVDVLGSYTDLDIPYKREIAENILTKLPSVTPQLSSGLEKNSKKLEKDFGELDCISRQDVLSEIIRFSTEEGASVECQQLYCDVNNMPSVIPQEPKTGHWIEKPHVYGVVFCSECGFELRIDNTNYCPNCGADMREVIKYGNDKED